MILSPSLVGEAIGMGADQLVDVKVASHTKLDSHADMTVVGKKVFVLAETGSSCDT